MAATSVTGSTTTYRILVVGYGNTLRGDDGLGPYIAEQFATRRIDGVTTRTLFQLTPELAEELATAAAAIFVDASVDASQAVSVRAMTARPGDEGFTHVADVERLMGLTKSVFQCVPPTWLVSVAGTDFAFHEGLSMRARANARVAVQKIQEMVNQISPLGVGPTCLHENKSS